MELSKLKNKIVSFPQTPGVYVFRGVKKEILYIGKATNLRSRVQSYFRGADGRGERIFSMVAQATDVEIRETDSVLEALILEANLIKKYRPKYNIKEKDDKSFSYFVITKEKFPRALILRETDLKKNAALIRYSFGPYTSKKQTQIALDIMRKIFPFHSMKQQSEKGCLDFQIGRCPGPYAGAITPVEYSKNIRGIRMILEGKKPSLLKKMKREMGELAKKQEYEKAGEARNKIFALEHIRDIALISREDGAVDERLDKQVLRIEAYDISNISGQNAVGSMVVFANKNPEKKDYRKFKIRTVDGANDVGMMREVLSRRFMNDWPQPDLIILDGGKGHLNMAEELLRGLGFVIPLVAVAKGAARKNLELHVGRDGLTGGIKKLSEDKVFLKRITDEAHRFAINYHKKLRAKNFIS